MDTEGWLTNSRGTKEMPVEIKQLIFPLGHPCQTGTDEPEPEPVDE